MATTKSHTPPSQSLSDPSSVEVRARLADWLASQIGASRVEIAEARLLTGGAVQQNWRLDIVVEGGPRAGAQAWVLRTDAAARLDVSLDRLAEYRCIATAYDAGVKVAEPIAVCDDTVVIGRPFAIQAFVAGTAQGRRIVRDPDLATFGDTLAGEIGRELARIHAIRPAAGVLPFLPVPIGNPSRLAVAQMRAALDTASAPRPALEYILAWLDTNAPEPRTITLVHGDFRTGNYMVDAGRLTAVLDWEFCHWGDPREDLGWFIARCWRFGNDAKVAGGIARFASLLNAYNETANPTAGAAEVQYFEVLAAARWATIALLQGDRFVKGGERSLELALTGLMPPEMELDALDIIGKIANEKGRA
jgi:aminoglycoside phosphotransferase (APT) family kinase protein